MSKNYELQKINHYYKENLIRIQKQLSKYIVEFTMNQNHGNTSTVLNQTLEQVRAESSGAVKSEHESLVGAIDILIKSLNLRSQSAMKPTVRKT